MPVGPMSYAALERTYEATDVLAAQQRAPERFQIEAGSGPLRLCCVNHASIP